MTRLSIVASIALAAVLAPTVTRPDDSAPSATLMAPVAATAASPEQLLRDELKTVLVKMIDSGAFGATAPERIALSLSLPAERYVNLGLLIDTRPATRAGVPVLGTLPGGGAQRLGVRAGDVITAVNGKSLAGGGFDPRAVAMLKQEVDALREGGAIDLALLRDGNPLTLAGEIKAQFLPAVRLELGEGALVASTGAVAAAGTLATPVAAAYHGGPCGRISVFHAAPRSRQLYAAKIISLDGEIPGPNTQDTYRVAPGHHLLEVAEQINDTDLPQVYSRARRHKYKTLAIDVRAGTTYLVASQLNLDHQRDVPRGGYWDPVVWKEIAEACR